MNRPVRLRVAAEQDIVSHAEYIKQRSVNTAIRFLDTVDQTFDLLGRLPEIGTICQFSNPLYSGLRVWPVQNFKNHLIFYRIFSEEVEVIRVLHGARDLSSVFGTSDE